jgi:hypothetical protein
MQALMKTSVLGRLPSVQGRVADRDPEQRGQKSGASVGGRRGSAMNSDHRNDRDDHAEQIRGERAVAGEELRDREGRENRRGFDIPGVLVESFPTQQLARDALVGADVPLRRLAI